jgi:two-component system OmpR family response regulator
MSQSIALSAQPAARGSSFPATTALDAVQPAAGPLRVFLVEDSALFRERLSESLASACDIEFAGWADREQAAIDALKHCAWDVLILDLQLKQGTGLGVLGALRSLRRAPSSKIIILTNHDFYLYRRRASEVGADFYMVKGRDFRRLVEVLREMAAQRSSQRDAGARRT